MSFDAWRILADVVIAAVSFIFGVFLTHFLEMRKERLKREWAARREGKNFYIPWYGYICTFLELIMGYPEAKAIGKSHLIVNGFKYFTAKKIIQHYNDLYKEFTQFLAESKKRGLEIYVPTDLANRFESILAWVDVLYEDQDWDNGDALQFHSLTVETTRRMEELYGLRKKDC